MDREAAEWNADGERSDEAGSAIFAGAGKGGVARGWRFDLGGSARVARWIRMQPRWRISSRVCKSRRRILRDSRCGGGDPAFASGGSDSQSDGGGYRCASREW